jgi:hypothetical protein
MAEIRLEKRVAICAPPEEVYAELWEPSRQLGLQPLLVEVVELGAGDTPDSRVFDAVELFRFFGVLRWRNRIRVRIDPIRPGEVVAFEARSFPAITVRSRFTLAASRDGTELHEEIRVDVPAPLRAFVAAQVDRAQDGLLANLEARLEARRKAR